MAVLTCLGGVSAPAAPSLKSHRIGDNQYVAVSDLAALYNLGRDLSSAGEHAEYRTDQARLILHAEDRDIFLNGVRHWLSFPVLSTRGRLWISALDVLKTIDPVLRQGRVSNSSPVRTIILDPGHGGTDRGTRGATGHNEKEFTLDLTKRLAREL